MKRKIGIFFIMLAAVFALCIAVSAEAEVGLQDTAELKAYLYEQLRSGADDISVAEFNVPKAQIKPIIEDMLLEYPDLFYINTNGSMYSMSYDPSTGNAVLLMMNYCIGGEPIFGDEVAAYRADYNERIEAILQQMELCQDGCSWTDFEKALWLHDYVVSHFAYDKRERTRDAYGFLTDGAGVCQSYYLLYRELLTRCGIACDYAASDSMQHVWNLVKLDGKWYHVDVTWDDLTYDGASFDQMRTMHEYFLCSDALIAQDHEDWYSEKNIICSDTSLDELYLRSVTSPCVHMDGYWYFMMIEKVGNKTPLGLKKMRADHIADSESKAAALSDQILQFSYDFSKESDGGKWMADARNYYFGVFSGLTEADGWLVFNTPKTIVAYQPDSGVKRVLLQLPKTESRYIYATEEHDGDLYYYLQTNPNEAPTELLYLELMEKLTISNKRKQDGVLSLTAVYQPSVLGQQIQTKALLAVYLPSGQLYSVGTADGSQLAAAIPNGKYTAKVLVTAAGAMTPVYSQKIA